MRLIYVHMAGCTTCAAVTPIVRAFADAHPEIEVVKFDLALDEWTDPIEPPETVPSFAVLRKNRPPRTISGDTIFKTIGDRAFTLADLERWALA